MIGDGIGKFMADVGALVEQKKITEITDIYNHSNKDGMRIVMELKKDLDKKKIENIKNILYKKTRLEDTYGVNMIAIGRKTYINDRSMRRFIKLCNIPMAMWSATDQKRADEMFDDMSTLRMVYTNEL